MIPSLIFQLYSMKDVTHDFINSLYSTHGDGHRRPTCELLCGLLMEMLEQVGEVYITLDALDKCRTKKGPPTEGVLSWLEELLISDHQNVHLLVTSRPE